VNASFVLTDAFDISNNFLGYAKIRGAWTQVGNEATPYRTATPYFLSTPFTTAGGSKFNLASLGNTLGNGNLLSELTTEIEFGADVRLLKNKVALEFTWFKRNSTNQITSTQVPASSGFTRAVVNAG
jgi:hypothetical protein